MLKKDINIKYMQLTLAAQIVKNMFYNLNKIMLLYTKCTKVCIYYQTNIKTALLESVFLL